MESLVKVGLWLYENWVLLVVAICVIIFVGKTIINYKKLSKKGEGICFAIVLYYDILIGDSGKGW